jgi:hypothetical protein
MCSTPEFHTGQFIGFSNRHSQAENPTRKTIEKIAEVFGVDSVELLGEANGSRNGHKPGPASRLQQLTQRLGTLPRNKQKVVVEMLEGFLQKAEH